MLFRSGNGRGGGIGGGGAPLRYVFTAQTIAMFQTYTSTETQYSLLQIANGNNLYHKLEVVSGLNLFNVSTGMCYTNALDRNPKYNIMFILPTLQTLSIRWIYDAENATNQVKIDPNTWPQNSPQKGLLYTSLIIDIL